MTVSAALVLPTRSSNAALAAAKATKIGYMVRAPEFRGGEAWELTQFWPTRGIGRTVSEGVIYDI